MSLLNETLLSALFDLVHIEQKGKIDEDWIGEFKNMLSRGHILVISLLDFLLENV